MAAIIPIVANKYVINVENEEIDYVSQFYKWKMANINRFTDHNYYFSDL